MLMRTRTQNECPLPGRSASKEKKNRRPRQAPPLISSSVPYPLTQPAAQAAAALTYEATAGLTSLILAGLWVWSRLAAARPSTTSTSRFFSIPVLAALFLAQWGAFTFLLVVACCSK